jgi:CheY-like chemotaxis protein
MTGSVLLLIVEDEPLVALTLQDVLEAGGYAVVAAENGAEAITALDGQIGSICGLITDIRLGPGADGWDVARHARQLNPSLPVIYTTANSAEDWPIHGVPKSVLVPKPYAPAQVLTAVSTLITKAEAGRTMSSGDH